MRGKATTVAVWAVAVLLMSAGLLSVRQSRRSEHTRDHLVLLDRQVRQERDGVAGLNGQMAVLSDALARAEITVGRSAGAVRANERRLRAMAAAMAKLKAERDAAEAAAEKAALAEATLTATAGTLRPG